MQNLAIYGIYCTVLPSIGECLGLILQMISGNIGCEVFLVTIHMSHMKQHCYKFSMLKLLMVTNCVTDIRNNSNYITAC